MPSTPADLPSPGLLPTDLAGRLRGRLSPAAVLREGVVRVAEAADVVTTVRLAGRHGIAVAVCADDLAPGRTGRRLRVDPDRLDEVTVSAGGWARVGAGVRWRQLQAAAARHSLAPLTGASAGERVADAVTGGGVGPLARTYGLASDRVRAVELVTGDGVLRRVTPGEHPDLFWAVRGGGAALGVVTAVELDLLAAGMLYAGRLRFAAADAMRVLTAWRDWSEALPAQAGTSVELGRPRRGTATVSVVFTWTGDPDDGAAVLDPLRAAARLLEDDVGDRTPADLDDVPTGPQPGVESSLLLDGLPAVGLGHVLRAARAAGPRTVEVRLLGGAVAWHPTHPSAVCHRDARLAVRVVGGSGPAERAATRAGVEELAAALGAATGGRAPAHGARAAPDVLARTPVPAVRDRLAALAAAADPHRILGGAEAPAVVGPVSPAASSASARVARPAPRLR